METNSSPQIPPTETSPGLTPATKPHTKPANTRRPWLFYTLVSVVVLFIVVGTGAFLTARSLPGERLYSVKTDVLERTIARVQLGASARAHYNARLLETRLSELTVLAQDHATTSPETLAVLAGLLERHTEDGLSALQEPSLAGEVRMDGLARISTLTRAAEVLTDTTAELQTIAQNAETANEAASDSLRSAVNEFTNIEPKEDTQAYIATQIQALGEEIVNVAPGSSAQRNASSRISDASELIQDEKFADALFTLLRAREIIAVDGYLFDSERGPIDGVALPSTDIPAGS